MSNTKSILLYMPEPHWAVVLAENDKSYAARASDGVITTVIKDGQEKVKPTEA